MKREPQPESMMPEELPDSSLIGTNKMELNGATMMAALQYYFDNVTFREHDAPRVTFIDKNGGNTFDVTVMDKPKTLL